MLFWALSIFSGVLIYYVHESFRKFQYWRARGIPSIFPYPLIGRMHEVIMMGQGGFDQKWTRKFGRIFGFFEGPQAVVEVSDTEMLREIMVKDFSHFVNRRDFDINGPVLRDAITALRDQRWKEVRGVLVPTFTSGKMRHMNNLIIECLVDMERNLDNLAKTGKEFEAKDLFGPVTMDIIASTFFGTKIDSQKEPNSPFVTNAKKAFDFSFFNPLILASILFGPKVVPFAEKLGLEGMPQKIVNFFVDTVDEIISMRRKDPKENSVRRDFLQLMLNSLKGRRNSTYGVNADKSQPVEEVTDVDIVNQGLSNGNAPSESELKGHGDITLTTQELVAQAVIFFLAGYETTATTLSFLAHCLTVNPHIQDRLREEILQVMGDAETPDYDRIAEMPYLDMCINETLRLYPPVARTERECNQDWEYKGLKVEKGTVVAIPIFAIHRDPEFWPEPEVYDPERFSQENKKNIKPYTFQTFGQGPRNCVGMRFAYFEVKMVMATVLQKYRFVRSPRTQDPLKIKDVGFIGAKDGFWMKLEEL